MIKIVKRDKSAKRDKIFSMKQRSYIKTKDYNNKLKYSYEDKIETFITESREESVTYEQELIIAISWSSNKIDK